MEENKKEQFHTNLQITDLIRLHKKASNNFAHAVKLNLCNLYYCRNTVYWENLYFSVLRQ